ncbi:MAG: hypothetical protein ABR999_01155 [Methanoregula sp.]|uniref:hypothetical protein n=1 Tax=Methanoregula sp. TaxID=2052170 RepID=UPI003D11B618
MKKWIIIFVICGAIGLLFTPVSGGFVNNISASQAIASPTVAAGGSVNITIRFSTPNEALVGAIEVNDTSLPAGWGISPVWDITNVPHDNPSSGTYYMTRSGDMLAAIWSSPNQAWAWTSVTSPQTPSYTLNYFVTVPSGTAPGSYTVHSYALTSPPAGGVQIAAIPGDTTITVTAQSSMGAAPSNGVPANSSATVITPSTATVTETAASAPVTAVITTRPAPSYTTPPAEAAPSQAPETVSSTQSLESPTPTSSGFSFQEMALCMIVFAGIVLLRR